MERNSPKVIYKLVKTSQGRTKDKIAWLSQKTKSCNKILSLDEVSKNRWKEYFGTLLDIRNHRKQLPVMQPTQGAIENITEREVKTQLDKIAVNKARGQDYLPVKVIKLLKDTVRKRITSYFRKIISEGINKREKSHQFLNKREVLLIVVIIGVLNF